MDRQNIIQSLKKFFAIEKLVCEHIYDKWRNNAWQFLNTDYLHALLIIRRDILKSSMTCNEGSAQVIFVQLWKTAL